MKILDPNKESTRVIPSHHIFFLCMDKLSHLIEQEVFNNKWKGIKMGENGPNISHLMFMDDLLLFGTTTKN